MFTPTLEDFRSTNYVQGIMIVNLQNDNVALRARIAELEAALNRIAYEPFGPSSASHAEVLDAITEFAIASAYGRVSHRGARETPA